MERLIWAVSLYALFLGTGCDSSMPVQDSSVEDLVSGDLVEEDGTRRDLLSNDGGQGDLGSGLDSGVEDTHADPDTDVAIDPVTEMPGLDSIAAIDMPAEDTPHHQDLLTPSPDLSMPSDAITGDQEILADEQPASDLSPEEDTTTHELGHDSEIAEVPDVVEEVTTLEFGIVTMDNEEGINTLEILLYNLEWIAGMQFDMVGIHADFSAVPSGGRLETVSPTFPPVLSNPLDDRARLLWFAFPDLLPPGNGVVTIIPFEPLEGFTEVCFEGVILSDETAVVVPTVVGPCVSLE